MDIEATITPIITSTYGDNDMSRALIAHLVGKIPTLGQSRQHDVMLTCWDWFSGGTTAESVARKIEEALS